MKETAFVNVVACPTSVTGPWNLHVERQLAVELYIKCFETKNGVCLFMSSALLHYAFVSESLLHKPKVFIAENTCFVGGAAFNRKNFVSWFLQRSVWRVPFGCMCCKLLTITRMSSVDVVTSKQRVFSNHVNQWDLICFSDTRKAEIWETLI